jgi:hypothetical protein
MPGIFVESVLERSGLFGLKRHPTAYRRGMVNVPTSTDTNLKEKKEIP